MDVSSHEEKYGFGTIIIEVKRDEKHSEENHSMPDGNRLNHIDRGRGS